MTELTTRDEFTYALNNLEDAVLTNAVGLATGERSDRRKIEDLLDHLHRIFDAHTERIAELEAEGAWQIRGQPDSELVLVSVHFKHRAGPVWDYYRVLEARWQCGKGWREAGGLHIMGHRRVTHWRPLPSPVIPEATDE